MSEKIPFSGDDSMTELPLPSEAWSNSFPATTL